MTGTELAVRQVRYQQKAFWRDPQAIFFTVGLPLLYFTIFATFFGSRHEHWQTGQTAMPVKTILVATIAVIGIVSAAFANLACALVEDRERGVLKRLRGTPVPNLVFIAGHLGGAVMLSILTTATLIAFGRVAYGVPIQTGRLPALVLTVIVASAAFCCLGLAFTLAVRKRGQAVAMTTGVTLTLYFLSGNFFNTRGAPTVIAHIAAFFPIRHLNDALVAIVDPHTAGMGVRWEDLAVVALWGVAGFLVAARFFRWSPTGEE